MPAKYSIHTHAIPPRLRPVGKLGIVDWREDCAGCHNCVKRSCVYGLYRDEADTLREEIGYLDYIYQCKGCLNCIQNCTKGILTRVENPEFRRLGDDYFTPEIILATWFQAESGRIPVSGSGYGGPFSGPGFDSMWTDMSEIVRPTRDGIHGREYISTSVDIGRKLKGLAFDDGRLDVTPLPLMELPLPVIFDQIPRHWQRGPVIAAVARAAAGLGTLAVVEGADGAGRLAAEHGCVVPLLSDPEVAASGPIREAPLVMIRDSENVLEIQEQLKSQNADRLVAIRIEATPTVKERVLALVRGALATCRSLKRTVGNSRPTARPDMPATSCGKSTGPWWPTAPAMKSRWWPPAASPRPSTWPRRSSAGPTWWRSTCRSCWRWSAGCAASASRVKIAPSPWKSSTPTTACNASRT